MTTASNFFAKVLDGPDLAQVVFEVSVLDAYLGKGGASVMRTDTVGRVKGSGWTLDFGIAPDEKTIHVPVSALKLRLPEGEREQWMTHVHAAHFSENFLKMQSSHACIDDGTFRAWGEEPLF